MDNDNETFSTVCFPSLTNQKDIEFRRNIILNQLQTALLYFRKNDNNRIFLNELLKFPGNDPSRDSILIMYKWSIRCFLYRIEQPLHNPSVPLDFTYIHPEISNYDTMYNYAVNSREDILRLVDTFPYEFFKSISRMDPIHANEFLLAISFNIDIPVHLISRIISLFPLSLLTIDFSIIYEKRCQSFHSFVQFFEGLLCNTTTSDQIKSAQYLANRFDDILNDEILKLINQSIRSYEHFLDKNLAYCLHLFPQLNTLSFLIQTSAAPFSTLAKAVKKLPPSEYVSRFRYQTTLMQILGIGEDWKQLEKHSVPFLLGNGIYPEILIDIPRCATFFNVSSNAWKNDYDFLQAYIAIKTLLEEEQLSTFPNFMFYDIFALLFLKYSTRRELRRSTSLPIMHEIYNSKDSNSNLNSKNSNINDSNTKHSNNLDPNNKYLHDIEFSNFVFSPNTVAKVITLMLKNDQLPSDLKKYLVRAENKIRNAISLFEKPIMENALLPVTYFYTHSLSSLELIDKIIDTFGDPPDFVQSRRFSLLLSRKLGLKRQEDFRPFAGRLSNDKPLNQGIKKLIDEVLFQFSENIHTLLILDYAATHKQLTALARENKDPQYHEFVNRMVKKLPHYPKSQVLDFMKPRTLIDLQKRLCFVISCNLKDSILTSWCAFLLLLSAVPNQTHNKLLTMTPNEQVINVISHSDSINEAVDRFGDTGIDILRFVLTENKPNIFKRNFIEDMIKTYPLYGIPYSLGAFDENGIENFIIDPKFSLVKKYFNKLSISQIKAINKFHDNNHSYSICGNDQNIDIINIKEIIDELKSKSVNESIEILDDLIFKYDLSPYFDEILILIQKYPKEWCISFIDTFISLLDADNIALIPLQQRKTELKPYEQVNDGTEVEKVCRQWDYLLKLITKYQHIVENSEKFFRLCVFHLKHHIIESQLVTNVMIFSQLILLMRNYHIFSKIKEENDYDQVSDQENVIEKNIDCEENEKENIFKVEKERETEFLNKFLHERISNLNKNVLAEMIIEIGLTKSYECGKDAATRFSKLLDLSEAIKKNLPQSAKLISYIQTDQQKLINEILESIQVHDKQSEDYTIHLLAKLKPYILLNDPLYKILEEFTHYGVCLRRKFKYSGNSMVALHDVATFCDLYKINYLFESLNVPLSDGIQTKFENELTIFGFSVTRTATSRKLIFTSPYIPFSLEKCLSELMSSSESIYSSKQNSPYNSTSSSTNATKKKQGFAIKLPTLYSMKGDENSLMIFAEPLEEKKSKNLYFPPDYKFFNVSYIPSSIRVSDDLEAAFGESLAFAEVKKVKRYILNDNRFITTKKLKKVLHRAIVGSKVIDLFNTLSNKDLHKILKYANSNNLLNLLLQLTTWTLSHPDAFEIFVFPGSMLEISDEIARNGKTFDYLMALKQTLISSVYLMNDIYRINNNSEYYDINYKNYPLIYEENCKMNHFEPIEIDASVIFPSSIIPSGSRRVLDDLCLVIEHQNQIGIKKLCLFDPNTDKSNTIAQLFVLGDYDRGFALTRILHADIDEVMIEASSLIVQNSESQLAQFLFNILPKLDVESSNLLIEALSSILVRSSKNEPFLKLLISGISDHQNVYQMLRWFGFGEESSKVAMIEHLSEEVEISKKDAYKKGLSYIVRGCNRYILHHKKDYL